MVSKLKCLNFVKNLTPHAPRPVETPQNARKPSVTYPSTWPKQPSDHTKTAPKRRQDDPKTLQVTSKTPKNTPETRTRPPRRPKDAPRSLQDPPSIPLNFDFN